MFTVCPKCALTLVVTAGDLRIAQGYVRCGRCLNVFNALARLSEERPGAAAAADGGPSAADALPQSATPSPPPTAPAMSAADDTGEIEIELDPSIFVMSARPPAPPRETTEAEAQASEPEPPEPEPPEPEPEPSEPEPPQQQRPTAPRAALPAREPQRPEPPRVAQPPPAESRAPESRAPAPAPAPSAASEPMEALTQPTNSGAREPSEEPFELATGRSRAALAWRLGAGALALALALQIVNHFRDALAANAALGGPLRTVYSALGVTLAPRWNVHAYDVRQLGASVDGATPGEIVVRASVKNAASDPQPLPLLRVTLQDRFGNRIAARDVPPRDYLPASVASSSLLAAGSRVDATMVFVDPGPQAVGFEIDACLPLARARSAAQPAPGGSGAVACAHGP
jgi:predicted Zn finger-like uncharacterized protein